MSKKTFVIVGAAGYIARKHMEAIRDVGGEITAIIDPNDSVGQIDAFSPKAKYYRSHHEYDARNDGPRPDYVVVCTPNHLHAEIARWGLSNGSDVICEKPVVIDPMDLASLLHFERTTGKRVFPILQLRYLPGVLERRAQEPQRTSILEGHLTRVTYTAPRGDWYHKSWKGDPERSGGLATNIGVHLFDLMCYIYGEPVGHGVYPSEDPMVVSGIVSFRKTHVKWRLSVAPEERPERLVQFDDGMLDISAGINQLHTTAYENILAGDGFSLSSTVPALNLVSSISRLVAAQEARSKKESASC